MPRLALLLLLAVPVSARAAERPNILWISCEDISPHLGCYGDDQAITPNLDQLASEGVRFTQAHHVHGVCAPARTGIITGMYPTALGCNHMRCKGRLPSEIKPFPQYLKEAGYFCTNNVKTDYNFQWTEAEVWNANSGKAHWRDRPDADKPFFSVFNFTMCHESRIWPQNHAKVVKDLPKELLHDPAKMKLPPYYPDTPKARASMARLYDVITAMDVAAGKVLQELEEDGLADDTIVIFWSDHGDGLPRAKRWVYDSGTHVPMLARIPEKYRTGDYGQPGTTDNRLISMIDLGPTVMNLAGLKVPEYMHGQAFMGANQPPAREYIHASRDRIDERYDLVRMVRDQRYRYMRTYMPWYPTLRMIEYAERNAIRQELRRLYAEGALQPEAAQFLDPTRPFEQLYDTQTDPHEISNLVADPRYADELARLRTECDRWMLTTRDAQLLPEPLLEQADEELGNRRAAVVGANGEARIRKLLQTVTAIADGSADIAQQQQFLKDKDPAVRWWGAMALGNDKKAAEQSVGPLQHALGDEATVVRVAAARALDRAGYTDQALPILTAALDDPYGSNSLWAITVLDEMDERARPVIDEIRATSKNAPNNYAKRVALAALQELEK